MLVYNINDRQFYTSSMYNDSIMAMYLVMAIYYLGKNHLVKGIFWLSMSLGLKAGVILIMPMVLGSIMYNNGLYKLVFSVLFMIAFQIVIALPFITTDTPLMVYLSRAKFTGAGRDGMAGAAKIYDFVTSAYYLTIFWSWVPKEFYYDQYCLPLILRIAIPLSNVYYFFIKKNCFYQCWDNLINFSKPPVMFTIKERDRVRFTLELLIIGYVAGVVLMPGAHI